LNILSKDLFSYILDKTVYKMQFVHSFIKNFWTF
jgi:hypothetical protein